MKPQPGPTQAGIAAQADRFVRSFLSGFLGEDADEYLLTMADGGHAIEQGEMGAAEILMPQVLAASVTTLTTTFERYAAVFAEEDGAGARIINEAFLLAHAAPLIGLLVGAVTEVMTDALGIQDTATPMTSPGPTLEAETEPVHLVWQLDGISNLVQWVSAGLSTAKEGNDERR